MKNLFIITMAVSVYILSASAAWAQGKAKAYVALSPAGDFVAELNTIKGSAQVSGDKISAKNIVIDLTTLKTGLELRDNHAKDKYLLTKQYPNAEIIEASGQGGNGQAKLKFRGKENTVNGTYKINGNKVDLIFNIKLSSFGIEDISYKGIGVDDEVKIEASIPITASAAVTTNGSTTKTANQAAPIKPLPATIPTKTTQPLKK